MQTFPSLRSLFESSRVHGGIVQGREELASQLAADRSA